MKEPKGPNSILRTPMSGEFQCQTDLETILRPNQIVAGRYRVERLMAEGGMAAVWAGVNLRTGKRVALKVILRSFAGDWRSRRALPP